MKKPKIFVCKEGFVLIGRPTENESPLFLEIEDCCCIRRWGTEKGLGQLAIEGIQTNTILDPEGIVQLNKTDIKRIIPCSAEKWNLWKP